MPSLVASALVYASCDPDHLRAHLDCVEAQDELRRSLRAAGLVAFVGDGSILPRASGVCDEPMTRGARPFESPPSLRVTLSLGEHGEAVGMGLPAGVTLIVGGGFHGKSTLLHALQVVVAAVVVAVVVVAVVRRAT